MAKKKKKPKPAIGSTQGERLELRLSADEKATFQAAADAQGVGLSQWLRLAGRMILRDHEGRVDLVNKNSS